MHPIIIILVSDACPGADFFEPSVTVYVVWFVTGIKFSYEICFDCVTRCDGVISLIAKQKRVYVTTKLISKKGVE